MHNLFFLPAMFYYSVPTPEKGDDEIELKVIHYGLQQTYLVLLFLPAIKHLQSCQAIQSDLTFKLHYIIYLLFIQMVQAQKYISRI